MVNTGHVWVSGVRGSWRGQAKISPLFPFSSPQKLMKMSKHPHGTCVCCNKLCLDEWVRKYNTETLQQFISSNILLIQMKSCMTCLICRTLKRVRLHVNHTQDTWVLLSHLKKKLKLLHCKNWSLFITDNNMK